MNIRLIIQYHNWRIKCSKENTRSFLFVYFLFNLKTTIDFFFVLHFFWTHNFYNYNVRIWFQIYFVGDNCSLSQYFFYFFLEIYLTTNIFFHTRKHFNVTLTKVNSDDSVFINRASLIKRSQDFFSNFIKNLNLI